MIVLRFLLLVLAFLAVEVIVAVPLSLLGVPFYLSVIAGAAVVCIVVPSRTVDSWLGTRPRPKAH